MIQKGKVVELFWMNYYSLRSLDTEEQHYDGRILNIISPVCIHFFIFYVPYETHGGWDNTVT